MQRRAILTYSGQVVLLLGALMVAVAATAHGEIKPLNPLGVESAPAAAVPVTPLPLEGRRDGFVGWFCY